MKAVAQTVQTATVSTEEARWHLVRRQLVAAGYPARLALARQLHINPFRLDNHNRYANDANVGLAFLVCDNLDFMRAGQIVGILQWDMLQIKAVVKWGAKQGYIELLSRNTYRITPEGKTFLAGEVANARQSTE